MKPVAIWHSGKLRARQTAEPFLRLCNPLAEFSAIQGLQPTDPPGLIKDLLTGEEREVMLVGHMPSLPRVLTLLVTGDESSAPVVSAPRRDRARAVRRSVDRALADRAMRSRRWSQIDSSDPRLI